MSKFLVILSYNSIIRGSAGFYISILGIWLILCGATSVVIIYVCYVLIFLYCGISLFLGVFLGLYFPLILLDYVFVMNFVYVHSLSTDNSFLHSLPYRTYSQLN
jgi:hypothetical protein